MLCSKVKKGRDNKVAVGQYKRLDHLHLPVPLAPKKEENRELPTPINGRKKTVKIWRIMSEQINL